jgi:hypothetical protein
LVLREAPWTNGQISARFASPAWAHAQGHPAVTLSTFRDMPWNRPFYRKHGFRDVPTAEWTPGVRAIRQKEAQHGLRVEARVFMRCNLDRVSFAT